MKIKTLHLIALSIVTLILLMSYSANPPQRSTGAPGEDTCARPECHSRGSARSGQFSIGGLPDVVIAGETYELSIELSRSLSSIRRGGFQMTIIDDALSVGDLSDPGQSTTISTTAGRQYAEHQPAETFVDEVLKYSVRWTAPQEPTSTQLTLYAAALLANGNNNRSGDHTLTLERPFSIIADTDLSVSADILSPSCGSANGAITLSVSGGVPPYTYSWVTDDETAVLSGISAGSYAVTITDQDSTRLDTVFQLVDGADRDAPRWQGTDTLRISSCAPFSYPQPQAIDDCQGSVSVLLVSGRGPGESYPLGTSHDVYTASDSLGNTSEYTVTIINHAPVSIDLQVQNIPCHDAPAGSVELIIDGENEPYIVSLLSGDLSLDSLPEGDHTLLIEDRTGCRYIEEIQISRPAPLRIDTIIVRDANTATSGDGQITPQISGGTGTYVYQWYTEGENFSNEEVLSNLFSGKYILSVTDENGCQVVSDTIIVDVLTSIYEVSHATEVQVYPTLTSDQLIVSNDTPLPIISITATSMHGRIHKIDNSVSHLPNGLYIISVLLSDGSVYWQRIVKTAHH